MLQYHTKNISIIYDDLVATPNNILRPLPLHRAPPRPASGLRARVPALRRRPRRHGRLLRAVRDNPAGRPAGPVPRRVAVVSLVLCPPRNNPLPNNTTSPRQGLIAVNYPTRKVGITRHCSVAEAKKLCPQLIAQHIATWREGASGAIYTCSIGHR
jgi:hypothetical protein